jgi:RHS repeat-associated protein
LDDIPQQGSTTTIDSARFYDASSGRFPTLDAFAGDPADPQSFHKYGYVHGDPVLGIDPTGDEFSLGGFSVAFGGQNQMRAMSGVSNLKTLKTAHSLRKTVKLVQQVMKWLDKASNIADLASEIYDLFGLEESDIQEYTKAISAVSTFIAGGGEDENPTLEVPAAATWGAAAAATGGATAFAARSRTGPLSRVRRSFSYSRQGRIMLFKKTITTQRILRAGQLVHALAGTAGSEFVGEMGMSFRTSAKTSPNGTGDDRF